MFRLFRYFSKADCFHISLKIDFHNDVDSNKNNLNFIHDYFVFHFKTL